MDIGTGIAVATMIAGVSAPVTAFFIRKPEPKNGDTPMTKSMCELKHKTLDYKIDLLLDHFDLRPKG